MESDAWVNESEFSSRSMKDKGTPGKSKSDMWIIENYWV
jgi:hypothetical protein